MIVAAWFIIVGFIVMVSFGYIIATFVHWYKTARDARNTAATEFHSSDS